MKIQKYFGLMVILALFFALVPATGVSAAVVKVPVCHLDKDSGSFFLINISDNAYDTHLNHGDVNPGDAIPGVLGMIYGEDCAPLRVFADVTGTWAGHSGLAGSMTFNFTMNLVQAADKSVTGTIYYVGYAPRPITGNISGFTFTFTQTDGTYWATVSGDVTETYYHGYGTHTGGAAVELEANKVP
ncbi:MAG: hypothetical protein WC837_13275 [Bellilinea sp.]